MSNVILSVVRSRVSFVCGRCTWAGLTFAVAFLLHAVIGSAQQLSPTWALSTVVGSGKSFDTGDGGQATGTGGSNAPAAMGAYQVIVTAADPTANLSRSTTITRTIQ